MVGWVVTAIPLVIIRSTSYRRPPPTCTCSDTLSPPREAVTVQVPTWGSSKSVEPVPCRVVSAPSEQVTDAPVQVVTDMVGLCTPMASFSACSVVRLCWPAVAS